ncbi:MAG TPA: 3-oxoacyl-ACP reductase FabG [Clostridiaceae bacterium]|nr:3-oxoacyl-ACP reductase FabG [Clostridiaceae bacterium]
MSESVVLVTGGSRGIGESIVRKMAMTGHKVILNYNKSEKEALLIKQELLQEQKAIDIFKADITKREEVKNLIQFCINKYNKIDVLVNNAGISQFKLFQDITDEDWNRMINTNLTSCFYTIQEVLSSMIKEKKGCIINISSIWGSVGAACEVHYSVSKAGLDAMTKALAKELGPSGIRVNSIAPGIINTSMNNKLNAEEIHEIIDQIPLGKIGDALDIAKCVEWLIEDEYTTGQIIGVNGGWCIR